MRRSYSAAGTFSLSLSRLDIEKPPGDIHRWRRTNLVVTGLWLLAFVQSPGEIIGWVKSQTVENGDAGGTVLVERAVQPHASVARITGAILPELPEGEEFS